MVLMAALLLPSTVLAQRGGGMGGMGGMGRGGMGGGRRGGRSGGGEGASAPQVPSSDDILKDSPLRLLIDKAKDLSLADSQRTSIVNQQAQLDQRLQHLLVTLDSAKANRPRVLSDSERAGGGDQREAAMSGFRMVRSTLASIRAAEDSAAVVAVNGLSDKQRAKAYKLLAARRDKLDKEESPHRGFREGNPPQSRLRIDR
jgi:hypothetical protein